MTTILHHAQPATQPAPKVWPCDRPRRRWRDRLLSGDVAVRVLLLSIVVYGCAKKYAPLDSFGDIDGAGGRIDLRAQQIGEDAKAVRPRTDTVGRVHVKRIEANAGQIIEDVGVQQKASATASKAYVTVSRDLDTEKAAHTRTVAGYESRWYVKIGRVVDRVIKLAWWLFALLIGGGFVLRIIAMFAGGWGGAAMAKIGSIGLHMLPIVGGVANQFFDNMFFRDRQFKLESPKPLPPAAIVVDQAVLPATVDVAEPLTPASPQYTSTTVRKKRTTRRGK